MATLQADVDEYERLADDLKRLAKKAYPHAMRNGINRAAFATRKVWQKEISREFIERNRFTQKSIRVDKARGLNTRGMEAVLGSTARYMGDREKGERKTSKGKHGIPIPTSAAAGQFRARKRTRLVSRAHRIANISVRDARVRRFKSKRQRIAALIKMARASGKKFVFMDTRRKGFYRIMGSKRKPKLRMMWSVERRGVNVKPMPTLKPALDRAFRAHVRIMTGAIKQQLKRNRLLGFR